VRAVSSSGNCGVSGKGRGRAPTTSAGLATRAERQFLGTDRERDDDPEEAPLAAPMGNRPRARPSSTSTANRAPWTPSVIRKNRQASAAGLAKAASLPTSSVAPAPASDCVRGPIPNKSAGVACASRAPKRGRRCYPGSLLERRRRRIGTSSTTFLGSVIAVAAQNGARRRATGAEPGRYAECAWCKP